MSSTKSLVEANANIDITGKEINEFSRYRVLKACELRRVKVTNVLKIIGTRRSLADMVCTSTSIFMMCKIATALEIRASSLIYGTELEIDSNRWINLVGKSKELCVPNTLALYSNSVKSGIRTRFFIGSIFPFSQNVSIGSIVLAAYSGCQFGVSKELNHNKMNVDDIVRSIVQYVEVK